MPVPAAYQVFAVGGIPEVRAGDDLAALLHQALTGQDTPLLPGDVLCVTQKIVSKAEDRVIPLDTVTPSPIAIDWAERWDKDARAVELVLRESRRIVRMDRGVIIAETRHGWICANAGVDASNTTDADTVVLLPRQADRSAGVLRTALTGAHHTSIGVIVTDTFGRPWREGLTEVALGVAGIEPLLDFRGHRDLGGRELQHTTMAIADDIACAAGLVMLKDSGIAAAVVRGAPVVPGAGGGHRFIRPAEFDLFR
jgi:coenzyme F420-0:L-glutamate ligase/coenzyme F420-1:gamma-L-glutamate ligase